MLICIDNVLSSDEAAEFRRQIEGADWEDGAKSAGAIARLNKNNRQLSETLPLAITIRNEILRRLGNHPQFVSAALPGKIYPPRFNRYDVGNTYGTHVDSAVMRIPGTSIALRSDLSATIFLSNPDSYDGGELEIDGVSGTQTIKLEAGHMVLYESSSLHRVTPVTRGTRYASFLWVESMVHESSARTALYDLDQAIQRLTTTLGGKDASVLQLSNVYHNLLRYWAKT